MNREKWANVALGVCVAGLLIAMIGLLPYFANEKAFPWPVFVGPAVYMPGAFAYIFLHKGKDRRLAMTKLRFLRLGFVAVFAVAIYRILPLV